MRQFLRNNLIVLLVWLPVAALVCGLLSRLCEASWIETVGGFILMSFSVPLTYVRAQKRKNKREANQKLKPDNPRPDTTQPNAVGKALVAQQRSDFFFCLRMWGIGALFGVVAGLTISGFWSGILNRCPTCGRFDAEQAHRRFAGNATVYYNCPGTHVNKFSVPNPQRDTLVAPVDDR